MKHSVLSVRVHRIAQSAAVALLALAALGASCGPPCLKSLPTPAAKRAAARATASPTPGFDLIADPHADANHQNDENGILLNPIWQYQKGTDTNPPNSDDKTPKPAGSYDLEDAQDEKYGCFTGNNWFTDPKCTLQPARCDLPTNLFKNLICTIGNFKFNGHMNWQPATYEGHLFWDQKATDKDFDFLFYPPQRSGMTTASCKQRSGAIGVEFDSREVVDEIDTIGNKDFWWRRFIEEVNGGDPTKMFEGNFAILTGLMGLDCEHGCNTEIHPVWALALHDKDSPDDDQWALFARNWGNEGFCSAQQHELPSQTKRFVLRLPWRPRATAVEVLTARSSYCQNFKAAPGAKAAPTNVAVTFRTGEAVFVTFDLPEPKLHAFVLGELHLKWLNGQVGIAHPHEKRDPEGRCNDAPAVAPPPPLPGVVRMPQTGDERLEAIMKEIEQKPEMWQTYQQYLKTHRPPPNKGPAVIVVEQMICTPFSAAQPAPERAAARAAAPASPAPTAAPLRDIRDKAICVALGAQAKAIGEKYKVADFDKACKQLLKSP